MYNLIHLKVYGNTAKMNEMISYQSESFNSEIKITRNTLNDGNAKDLLKSLENSWNAIN